MTDKTTANINVFEVFENAPVGILLFHKNRQITYVNKNFFTFNLSVFSGPAEIFNKDISQLDLFHGHDISKEISDLEHGDMFEREISVSKSLDGKRFSVILKGAPLYVRDQYSGGILILEDIKAESTESPIEPPSPKEPPLPKDEEKRTPDDLYGFAKNIADYFYITDVSADVKYKPDVFDFKNLPAYLGAFIAKYQSSTAFMNNQQIKNLFISVSTTHATQSADLSFKYKNEEVYLRVTLVPVLENTKTIKLIVVLVKDVSGEMREKNSREIEINELRKYQYITSSIIDAVISVDLSGNIAMWNEAAAKLFGHTKSEVFGKFIGKILPTIDQKYFESLKNELLEKKNWEGQLKTSGKEGTVEVINVKMGLAGEHDSYSIVMLCSSATERINLESELRKSEERFRNIVTNSHEYICTLDLNGKITYANPYFLKVFGYEKEEFLRLNFSDLLDTYYLLKNDFKFREVMNKYTQPIELPLVAHDGKKIHVLAGFSPIFDLNGDPQLYNAVLTDITIQKDAEKDLLLIRSVFVASQDGIAVISNRSFVLVNDSFVKMFGYEKPDEMNSKDVHELVAEEDTGRINDYMRALENNREAPTRFEFKGKRKDGSYFFVENSVSTYESNDSSFTVWVSRDVTEDKAAQQALRDSEERYRSITENISESIWTAERINGVLKASFYSSTITKITGYSSESFISNPSLWFRVIHPDDLMKVVTDLKRFYRDSSKAFDEIEYRIINNLGNIIWVQNKINVVRDEKGKVQKIFGLVNDVSLSKKAQEELQKSADNLKELNNAKDRFLSIISHDLRSPFSSILGFTDLLLTDEGLGEAQKRQYVSFIQESSKGMLALVNSLLDWTRLQTGRIKFEPERISASSIVTKVIQMVAGNAIQKDVELKSNIEKDLYIHADENLMVQAFSNLIANAIKFTKPGGNVIIDGYANVEKRNIQFTVADDGVGIREEDLPKLFKVDSKFTSPGTSGEKGSGLGLSLVQEIVQLHGGEIWVESTYGEGTKFHFTIPVSSTKILLVDDIRTDRLLYAKLFKNLVPNYEVIEASNGKEALEIVKHSIPALIITDHKMPVMTGYDLVKQLDLIELRYKPPVIVLSSDITNRIADEYRKLGIEYVFQKPVNLSVFKTALEKSLRKSITN